MPDRREHNNQEQHARQDDVTRMGGGKQGIDKDPDKDASSSPINPVYETQKGKSKVDGDPSQNNDQPVKETDV